MVMRFTFSLYFRTARSWESRVLFSVIVYFLSDFIPAISSDLLAFAVDIAAMEDFDCLFQAVCINGVVFAGVSDSDVLCLDHGGLLSVIVFIHYLYYNTRVRRTQQEHHNFMGASASYFLHESYTRATQAVQG